MPSISHTSHRVGARSHLDAQHIHMHTHIAVANRPPKDKPKPAMVDASTQTSATDIKDHADPRALGWPRLRRFRHRAERGLRLACHVAWSVISFYARRVTLGINLADALLGRGRYR